MNYFEKHIGDFVKDTAHLSMIEDGAYNRLIDQYYSRERPLPLDLRECCKLARATSKPERDAVAYVLGEFFDRTDDGYQQKRCDAEIAHFLSKQRKAKASADARWSAHRSQSEGNADAPTDAMRTHMPTQSEGNAPRARPQTPIPNPQPSSKAAGGRGSRLPADWKLPKAWGDWALAEFPQWNADKVRREGESFRDHWTAKSGKDATKLDWQATWRNWCRSTIAHRDDQRPAPTAPSGSAVPDADATTAMLRAQQAVVTTDPSKAREVRERLGLRSAA